MREVYDHGRIRKYMCVAKIMQGSHAPFGVGRGGSTTVKVAPKPTDSLTGRWLKGC